jgi:glycosyltransferase involved in cell wall biosynthesis
MKLLILSDAAAPHTRRWANWFAANGNEVHVITFNVKLDSGYSGVVVHSIWKDELSAAFFSRFVRSFRILLRLRKIVKEIRPDVVHSHSMGSYAWVATVLNLRPRVLTPWGTDLLVDINNSVVNRFLTRWSLRSADLVTTDAEYFFDPLIKLGVKKSRLILVPFGTDITLFKPIAKKTSNTLLKIVSTRTLNPVHSVEDLISVIPDLLKYEPSIQFIIVGGGANLETFRNQISDLGLLDRVTFTGMLDEKSLIEVLQNSDVYVSTSPLDAGLAASTAEAMACGLPVIHPDVADNRIWADQSGGALYTANNQEELKSALTELISLPEIKRVLMGEKNRKTIISRNNLNSNMNFVQAAYLDLVKRYSN